MIAKFDIGLERYAPAFLFCGGYQVLCERPRPVAQNFRPRQCGEWESVTGCSTNNFSTAVIIGLAVIAAQRQQDIFANVSLNRATNTLMFIAIDLFASGQIVNVAVIAAVKSGETRTHIGAQRQVNGRTTTIFGFREE